jgi:sigma-B regulation protein RsbU (phosphoserine phosphatase)
VSQREGQAGVPLGLLADVAYDRLVVKPQSRDLLVLYSDGVTEATSPAGDELGRDRLMNLARTLDSSSPETLGTQLTSAVRAFRGDGEPLDYETIIVIQRVVHDSERHVPEGSGVGS